MCREIMRAIFEGDVRKFDNHISQGVDLNYITQNEQWNFLHRALISVSIPPMPEMIKHLIVKGIDVNAVDCYGNTPLHYAARIKNVEIIEMLLEAKAEINKKNKDRLTPLQLMLRKKPVDLSAINLLLLNGAK